MQLEQLPFVRAIRRLISGSGKYLIAGLISLFSVGLFFPAPSWADSTRTPTEAEASKWSIEQAKNYIERFYSACRDRPTFAVEMLPDIIRFTWPSTPQPAISIIPLANLKITVTYDNYFGSRAGKITVSYTSQVWLSGKRFAGTWTGCNDLVDPDEWAKNVGNAVLRLKLEFDRVNNADSMEKFKEVALRYREASPKPDLPEEMRRLKIQAEDALKAKRFVESSEKYEKLTEIAPWWPDAHFNRALVLAELQCFDSAMNEMKRFLLLMPDSPLARAAQDKIYSWEAYPYSAN